MKAGDMYIVPLTQEGKWAVERVTDPEGEEPSHIVAEFETEADAKLFAASPRMLSACRAVLLFHAGHHWEPDVWKEWTTLAGIRPATSRALCDLIREATDEIK